MSLRFFSSFIIKANKPCINCFNYIKYKYRNPYDEIYDSNPQLGKCYIFGQQNLVTGEIDYADALASRIDDSKCGKEGRHYKTL